MKYTVEPILWKYNPDEHGHFPIYIKIYINGKRSHVATGRFISEKYWSDKACLVKESHPSASEINKQLTNTRLEIDNLCFDLAHKGTLASASQVKKIYESASKGDLNDIFLFLDDFKAEVKSKREEGTIVNYDKHFNILERFNGGRNLTFIEIDHRFLAGFEIYLREKELYQGNYIHTIFKDVRTVFNAARKRGITKHYPFDAYEFPKYVAPEKDYLTLKELERLELFAEQCFWKYDLKASAIWLLLGCYSGLRVSDWYLFNFEKNIHGNIIRLYADKNGKYVTMPISAPLARNLKRMAIFPLTLNETLVNRYLKDIAASDTVRIKKKVSTHTGRHTFAVTICLDNGVSSETAAELMGITLRTFVDNYSQVTEEKINRETKEAWKKLK